MTSSFLGATFGAFQPYPVPNSKQALVKTAKFVPLPPFSSLASVCFCAGMFGSVAAVNRFASGGMTVVRNRHDLVNELVGIGVMTGYMHVLLKSDQRIIRSNRAVAGVVIGSFIYANTAPKSA